MRTFRLNKHGNYALVYAHQNGQPASYSNITQAEKKANEIRSAGVNCEVRIRRPFYIIINEESYKCGEGLKKPVS